MSKEQSTAASKSTDVSVVKRDGQVAVAPGGMAGIIAIIAENRTTQTEVDLGQVWDTIADEILAATTPDELLNAGRALKADELLGVPLRIEQVKFVESDFDEGFSDYAVVKAYRADTGSYCTVRIGGQKPVMMLSVALQRGMLPLLCKIERAARPTAKGYFPMTLSPLLVK